jgi:hypothetical protein
MFLPAKPPSFLGSERLGGLKIKTTHLTLSRAFLILGVETWRCAVIVMRWVTCDEGIVLILGQMEMDARDKRSDRRSFRSSQSH